MRHLCNVVLRVLSSFEIMLLGRERDVTAFSVDYDCVFSFVVVVIVLLL